MPTSNLRNGYLYIQSEDGTYVRFNFDISSVNLETETVGNYYQFPSTTKVSIQGELRESLPSDNPENDYTKELTTDELWEKLIFNGIQVDKKFIAR